MIDFCRIAFRCLLSAIIVVASLLAAAAPCLAQRIPDLGYVFPPGGKAGTTVDVVLGGYDWTPDMDLLVHDPRVQLTSLGPPGKLLIPEPPYWFGAKGRLPSNPVPREMPARFTLPADLPPGIVWFQAASANGGTAVMPFVVGDGSETLEDERRTTPQLLSALPTTVSGRLMKIEEIDRYRFVAPRTGPITCELSARRIGSNLNPLLEVRDAAGKIVAEALDANGLDPAVTFAAKEGAAYEVAVRDLDFAGDRSFVYRLAVVLGPRVVAALPAAGRRGETRDVEFVGPGLATGADKLESIVRPVAFPADPTISTFLYALDTPFGNTPPFSLLVSDTAETVEPPVKTAEFTPLAAPCAVTGALEGPFAVDRYEFTAVKGEAWSIAASARRLGSPVDVSLAIQGADGKQLAVNDDLPGATDAGLEFVAPADGAYRLIVSDSVGGRGTRASVYRLEVLRTAPSFSLETVQRTLLFVGDKGTLAVKVLRKGGFAGPIALTIAGLPAGVSVPADGLVIPGDKLDLAIPLTVAADAPTSASLVSIHGDATIDNQPIRRQVFAPAPPTLALRGPQDNQSARLLVAVGLKPRMKGRPVDQDTGRKVHRGATFPADLEVERLEGFKGEILLRMAAKQSYQIQGITGYDVLVPPGEYRPVFPCFLPEWLESTRTSRMAVIGEVQVADPRGRVRHLVAEVSGFITMTVEGGLMKVSHSPREVTAAAGRPFDVQVQVSRSAKLPEPVKLELILPEDLQGRLTAEPVTVPPGQEQAAFRIVPAAGEALSGMHTVRIRGTALEHGWLPAISETSVLVEFTAADSAAPR